MNTSTVHHDPNSHRLTIAMNASLNLDSVFVIISEIPITMKETIAKKSHGKGHTTISLQIFPFNLYPFLQLVHVVGDDEHVAHGLRQAVQLLVVVFVRPAGHYVRQVEL